MSAVDVRNFILVMGLLGEMAFSAVFVAADPGAEEHLPPVIGSEAKVIAPCADGTYLSIGELRSYCGERIACGSAMDCEGKVAYVAGEVDPANIWEKSRRPWLPFEKFFLRDGKAMLEVRVAVPDSAEAFRKIRSAGDRSAPLFLMGMILAVETPAMRDCHQDIVLIITRNAAIRLAADLR
jgi:hypothetical protein